ncbi:hypothetical protein LINPERHAP1_LOCUS12974, partial [Linum perenne]
VAGRCSVVQEEGLISIAVEEEGIEDRLRYLERCVVFRFVGGEKVNWKDFWTWAARNWGVHSSSEVYPVGDDLWLLECASLAEVNRVLSLNRGYFGRSKILMGPWIKMAGRSKVAWDANIGWVVVRGIPLHLRSPALATSIGEVCGEILDWGVGPDLSSMRVKVRVRGRLPEVIPISVGGEVFPVSVTPEVCFPVVNVPMVPDLFGRKGKKVCCEEESSKDLLMSV